MKWLDARVAAWDTPWLATMGLVDEMRRRVPRLQWEPTGHRFLSRPLARPAQEELEAGFPAWRNLWAGEKAREL